MCTFFHFLKNIVSCIFGRKQYCENIECTFCEKCCCAHDEKTMAEEMLRRGREAALPPLPLPEEIGINGEQQKKGRKQKRPRDLSPSLNMSKKLCTTPVVISVQREVGEKQKVKSFPKVLIESSYLVYYSNLDGTSTESTEYLHIRSATQPEFGVVLIAKELVPCLKLALQEF